MKHNEVKLGKINLKKKINYKIIILASLLLFYYFYDLLIV